MPNNRDIRDYIKLQYHLREMRGIMYNLKNKKTQSGKLTEDEKESYENIMHKIAMLNREIDWLKNPVFEEKSPK